MLPGFWNYLVSVETKILFPHVSRSDKQAFSSTLVLWCCKATEMPQLKVSVKSIPWYFAITGSSLIVFDIPNDCIVTKEINLTWRYVDTRWKFLVCVSGWHFLLFHGDLWNFDWQTAFCRVWKPVPGHKSPNDGRQASHAQGMVYCISSKYREDMMFFSPDACLSVHLSQIMPGLWLINLGMDFEMSTTLRVCKVCNCQCYTLYVYDGREDMLWNSISHLVFYALEADIEGVIGIMLNTTGCKTTL